MVNLTFGPTPEGENPSNASVPTNPPAEANLESVPAVPAVEAPKPRRFHKRSLIIAGVAGFVLVAGAGAYFSSGSDAFKGSFRDIGSTRGVEDRAIVAEVAQQPEVAQQNESTQQEPVISEEVTSVETDVQEPVQQESVIEPPKESPQQPKEESQQVAKVESSTVPTDSSRVARKPRVAEPKQPVIQNSFSNEEPTNEEPAKKESELVATIPVFDPTSFKFVSAPGLESGTNTVSYKSNFKQAITFKYLLPIYETYDQYDYNGKVNPPLYSAEFKLELCNSNLDICDQIAGANLAVQKNVKDVESRSRSMTLTAKDFKSAIVNFLPKAEGGMMVRLRVLDPRGMYHYTKAFKLYIPQEYLDALK